MKFQTGKSAIKKTRENIEHALGGYKEGRQISYIPTAKGHIDFRSKTSATRQLS